MPSSELIQGLLYADPLLKEHLIYPRYLIRMTLPPKARMRVSLLYALEAQILQQWHRLTDPAPLEKSVAFWTDELLAMRQERASHPLTKALGCGLDWETFPNALWQDWLQALRMRVNYHGFATYADLSVYIQAQSAFALIMVQLIDQATNQQGSASDSVIKAFSDCHHWSRNIQRFGHDFRQGVLRIDEAQLQSNHLDATEWLSAPNTAVDFAELFKPQVNAALAAYGRGCELLSSSLTSLKTANDLTKGTRFWAYLNAIDVQLLAIFKMAEFNVKDQWIDATPLQKIRAVNQQRLALKAALVAPFVPLALLDSPSKPSN